MRAAVRLAGPAALLCLLAGCGTLSRLAEVGRDPALSTVADPTADPAWRPVAMPMPPSEDSPAQANALWRPGSRAFFKDQRAAHVGDLVTVLVNITDAADLKNQSTATRNGSQSMGIPNLFGFENLLPHILPKPIDPTHLVSISSNGDTGGNAAIKRNETITLRLAGTVTQILPNGNMVVAAKQEVRVNGELRELQVSGVIRPQDIASDNTVVHDRMAEARIAYGGRGQMTDIQRPRVGQQLLDILLPF